jgi:hypothetical protein
MGFIESVIEEELPGTYVYSIRIGESEDDDRNKSFFDLIDRQVRSLVVAHIQSKILAILL